MLRDLVDLVLPVTCALCHRPGARLCPTCRGDVRGCLSARVARCRPDPEPAGMPPCWVAGTATGALRALVTAYKDEDRRDLAGALGALLAPALRRAAAGPEARAALVGRGLLVVPVLGSPRARRRRGDVPLVPVVQAASRALPGRVVVAPVLVPTRVTRDQSRLGAQARADNLAHSMAVPERREPTVRGSVCVVVDDLVTTGATLTEAARALTDAGAAGVVAAAIGATPRRFGGGSRPIS